MNNERKKEGRPFVLDDDAVDKLVSLLDFMVVSADGRYEVTVDMLRRKARSKAGSRTISEALHNRRVYFRRPREKPVLTAPPARGNTAQLLHSYCTVTAQLLHSYCTVTA